MDLIIIVVSIASLLVLGFALAIMRQGQVQRQFAGVVTHKYVHKSHGTYGEHRQCRLMIRCDDGTTITETVSAQVYRDIPVGCHVTKQPGRRWPDKTVTSPPQAV